MRSETLDSAANANSDELFDEDGKGTVNQTEFFRSAGQTNNCATEFGKKGIKIVVEPIRRAESNFINTVLEEVDFAKGINNTNLGYMVDLFHFYQNGENLCDLDLLKGQLTHAHIARPNLDRNGPKLEDEETIRIWMQKLKEIGYDDRLTLECIWTPDIETAMGDTAQMMPLMRGEI